jgi:hypothetical protein
MKKQEADIKVGEVWRHVKTGGEYEIIGLGKLQVKNENLDNQECVIYKSVLDKHIWVRPVADFLEIVDRENNTQRFVKLK